MLKIYILLLVVATLSTLTTCKLLHDPGVVEKCLVENNVTGKELQKKLSKEYAVNTDGVDRRYKCYMKCLFNGLKLTDQNGRLDATKFGNQDPSEPTNELYAEVANTCNKKYSSVEDQCENIFNVAICIIIKLQNDEEEQKVFELIRNNFTDIDAN